MIGFEVWNGGNCIHEETGYDCNMEELFEEAKCYCTDLIEEEANDPDIEPYELNDLLCKFFDGDREEELLASEL
jgi:hypothetical protein